MARATPQPFLTRKTTWVVDFSPNASGNNVAPISPPHFTIALSARKRVQWHFSGAATQHVHGFVALHPYTDARSRPSRVTCAHFPFHAVMLPSEFSFWGTVGTV